MQCFSDYFTENYKVVQTPAFKEWFKGSKVVDEQGNPLVVYHGSNRGGFHTFYTTDEVLKMPYGAHFGNLKQAETRLQQKPDKGRDSIYPAYLSIKNPLYTFDRMSETGWVEAIDEARAAGHDGIIYKNNFEGDGHSYLVFDPHQIKSVFNKGTFNPSNPDIRH